MPASLLMQLPAAIRPGHGRKSSSCQYNRQPESSHSQYQPLPVYFSFSVFFCSSIAFWIDEISVFRDAIVSCFSVIFSLWGQTSCFFLPGCIVCVNHVFYMPVLPAYVVLFYMVSAIPSETTSFRDKYLLLLNHPSNGSTIFLIR